jgi:hypothetical protein
MRARYPEFADTVVKNLLACLQTARELFEGDLDYFVILMAVAARTLEAPAVKTLDFEAVLAGEVESYPGPSTNVTSLSDSLGLPRETVRRKVGEMIAAGYLQRTDNRLTLTPAASIRFSPVREQVFRAMLQFRDVVEELERTEPEG